MKGIKYLFVVFLSLLIHNIVFSQNKSFFSDSKGGQYIHTISFSNKNEIILNNIVAYKYERIDNIFTIKTLEGKDIIKGTILSRGNNRFETIITFIELGVDFSNPKIVLRNDLILALCDFNVFNTDLSINQKKLKQFIERFDTLEGE